MTSESETILRNIADTLLAKPNLIVEVRGYTYTAGSSAANILLSQARANQVRDYLTVNLLIASDRIQTLGHGSENQISADKAGKETAKGNRVEIYVRQPDAILVSFENDVKVQPPALRPEWLTPVPNYYLYSGYRIATGKKSSAHILYPNNSMLRMDEDALVIIHSLSPDQEANSFIQNIKLQDGALTSLLESTSPQDDSSTSKMTGTSIPNLHNGTTLVDEKLEDLIIAYQNEPQVSTPMQQQTLNSDQHKATNLIAPGQFGFGVIIGEPTGICFKKWLDGDRAFDFQVGWSFPGKRVHIAADYLLHISKWSKQHGWYPYLAIGSRLKIKTEQEEEQFMFGIRFGCGIEYFYGKFSFHGELYPVVELLPRTEFGGIEGGVGFRCYLKS